MYKRQILDRVSNGECTVQDYEILMTRSIQTFSQNERNFFNDAIRLLNHQKLKEFLQPIAYIPAIHNCSKAKSASAESVSYTHLDVYKRQHISNLLRVTNLS